MSQYNQPIYVSSSSSQSLSQQQMNNVPIPNQNGPIYVSSNVAQQPPMPMYQQPGNILPEQGIVYLHYIDCAQAQHTTRQAFRFLKHILVLS